jgi:tetratricopeptide (TPR) repeat protein
VSDNERDLQRVLDLMDLGKFNLAAEAARDALARDPQDADAHYYLAWALWKLGKPQEAISSAESALNADPKFSHAHNLLARLFDETANYAKAEQHHQLAITLLPEEADFYVGYAYHLYLALPEKPFIIEPETPAYTAWNHIRLTLDKALKLNPRHAGAFRVRAKLFERGNLSDLAREDLLMALQIDPNNSVTHALLGDTYLYNLQPSQASSIYQESLRLDPQDKSVQNKLTYSQASRLPWTGEYWRLRSGWFRFVMVVFFQVLFILFLILVVILLVGAFIILLGFLLAFFKILIGSIFAEYMSAGWINI